jgi:hypothetical protein
MEVVMTPALRLVLVTVLFSLLLASPAAARSHRREHAARMSDDAAQCLDAASRDEIFAQSMRGGTLSPDSDVGPITSATLSGSSLSDDELWNLVGGGPSLPLSRREAVALIGRLALSGLFAQVAPQVGPGGELQIALADNPRVSSVRVTGLSEFRTEDVVDALLPPSAPPSGNQVMMREARSRDCPAPVPPAAWLARVEENELRPGILWHGLRASLERTLRYLRSRGYPLARIEGELTAAGDLLVNVDEGRIGNIEVRGVDAHLVHAVRNELGIRRGDIFSSGELYSALDRIRRRWPFLKPDRRAAHASSGPALRLDPRDGGIQFHTELASAPPRPRVDEDEDDDEADDDRTFDVDETPTGHMKRGRWGSWYGFEGDTLVVHLRSERSTTDVDWAELFRHTPVTGFAPGVAGTLNVFDPGDRVHLLLDGAINLNTRRSNHEATGEPFFDRLNARERIDWLLGSRIRLPGLAIAELGGQIHALTDTADRWRISDIDSYLYSALINRADREYFRRSGVSAFVTFHFFEELTLGAEYRHDSYGALEAPHGVWSLFNRDDPRYGSAPVDAGEMGSALFRLEYRSEKLPLHRVGSIWRDPEISLADSRRFSVGLRSVDTVEVADRSLGGLFDFTKFVSDNLVAVETGQHETLSLRLRGAGGRDLPLQKEEGLGGWNALRGYDFKEFRGDASFLGTLQLEGRHLGAFFDVGTVHVGTTGWIDPKPAAGVMLSFADGSTRAEAAWRLDGHGRALPDFRILFSVPR